MATSVARASSSSGCSAMASSMTRGSSLRRRISISTERRPSPLRSRCVCRICSASAASSMYCRATYLTSVSSAMSASISAPSSTSRASASESPLPRRRFARTLSARRRWRSGVRSAARSSSASASRRSSSTRSSSSRRMSFRYASSCSALTRARSARSCSARHAAGVGSSADVGSTGRASGGEAAAAFPGSSRGQGLGRGEDSPRLRDALLRGECATGLRFVDGGADRDDAVDLGDGPATRGMRRRDLRCGRLRGGRRGLGARPGCLSTRTPRGE